MKFLSIGKDGGEQSTVTGYWLFEIKWLCSIVLLKFEDGSRDAYHDHAFNSISWVLWGYLLEENKNPPRWPRTSRFKVHCASVLPVFTWRSTTHKVNSVGTSWVLSFRGPWSKTWKEHLPGGKTVTLTNGRIVKQTVVSTDHGVKITAVQVSDDTASALSTGRAKLPAGFTLGAPICPGVVSEAFKEKLRLFGCGSDE